MLTYYSSGSGPKTLVLIHGFCENKTCFDEQVLFFKASHQVITIDLPGFGKSSVQPDISIAQMADAVYEVLQHLNIRTCTLLGHSMGGYVTLAFANKYANMLNGFGLIHSTALADNEVRIEKRKQVMALVEHEGKEVYINNFIPTLFADANRHEVYVNTFVQEALLGPAEGIIAGAQAMMLRPDLSSVLKETNLAVFFAIGKMDPIIPEEVMIAQAAWCKQAQICYLQTSSHMGMVEQAEKLNQGIESFLLTLN